MSSGHRDEAARAVRPRLAAGRSPLGSRFGRRDSPRLARRQPPFSSASMSPGVSRIFPSWAATSSVLHDVGEPHAEVDADDAARALDRVRGPHQRLDPRRVRRVRLRHRAARARACRRATAPPRGTARTWPGRCRSSQPLPDGLEQPRLVEQADGAASRTGTRRASACATAATASAGGVTSAPGAGEPDPPRRRRTPTPRTRGGSRSAAGCSSPDSGSDAAMPKSRSSRTQRCSSPRMFTIPASSPPRCGTRCGGRGRVTSTSTPTGSASHSSPRRKTSTLNSSLTAPSSSGSRAGRSTRRGNRAATARRGSGGRRRRTPGSCGSA